LARLVERSYLSLLLEADPDYYTTSRNTNRAEYRFSNGREFLGHNIYENYKPFLYGVEYLGIPVFYNGEIVTYQTTELYDEFFDNPYTQWVTDDDGNYVVDVYGRYVIGN
jgi:hypothetical protein